jgi:hypothetical protein
MGGVNPHSVQAAGFIGNLPQSNDDDATFDLRQEKRKGISFTLPSGSNYSLTDAILRFGDYDVADEAPIVELWSNGAGVPGALLTTLNTPAPQGTGAFDYTFTPINPFTFTAGETYWLYVYGSASGGQQNPLPDWLASLPSITPTGIATYGDRLLSFDSGTTWGVSTTINSFQINAKSVPEPASILGLVAFGVGLVASKRRQD